MDLGSNASTVLSIADSAACAFVVVADSVVFAVITDAVANADVVKCIAVDFIAVMTFAFIAGRFEIANAAALLVAGVVVFVFRIRAATATVEAATFCSTSPTAAVAVVVCTFVSVLSLR